MTEGTGILPAAAVSFEAHVPLLIVGGGACGLTAALAAHEAGAEVVVLERDPRCEGSSAMSLGAMCASGTAEQARHGIDDDAQAFAADIMAKTQGRADPLLAHIAATRSGPVLDWLAEVAGVKFDLDLEWRPAFGHTRRRMHATPSRSGEDMMARFVEACDARSIPLLTNARVVALYADEAGAIAGVRIQRPDRSEERIGCGALILACCGFGGNHAMVAAHMPTMAGARYFGWEGNQGDGIRWGAALGGAVGDMDAFQGLGLLAEPHGIDVNPKLLLEGGVQVNLAGVRFSNEVDDVSGQAARVLAQPGGICWLVYDERIHREYGHLGEYRRLLDLGAGRVGETLAALAGTIGVPAAALAATLSQIDAARAAGRPDEFGRHFDRPALTAPFRALKVTGALFHTQGGLQVDGDARVVRADGSPLPNLYAGGGAARSIGGPGGSGYLPGAGLCMAITLGWIAGQAAARQVTAGTA